MIYIVFAYPRTGKTAYLTAKANEYAYDFERIDEMNELIQTYIESGFSSLEELEYAVYSDFEIECNKFGFSPRYSTVIDPFKIGFSVSDKDKLFIPPYSAIFISEGQTYLDSREYKTLEASQSRYYEQHGHFELDIYIDVQRPNLIDLNIKGIAQFIEIVKMTINENTVDWELRKFDRFGKVEKYLNGDSSKELFTNETFTAPRYVIDGYDTHEKAPLFFSNHFNEPFLFKPKLPTQINKTDYQMYCKTHKLERTIKNNLRKI